MHGLKRTGDGLPSRLLMSSRMPSGVAGGTSPAKSPNLADGGHERISPKGEKAQMVAEMIRTLSRDPFSVQFLRPWLWSLLPAHSPLGDRLPWMNFRAIRWLNAYLTPKMRVFEYGAGGSTLFAARRAGSVTSIEHDPAWHARVVRALDEEGITNVDLRLVPAEWRPSGTDIPYGPESYTSANPKAAGYSFEGYVRTIDGEPDRSFDLVIVDGYARFSCVAHAIPKVKRGGCLLFDDTDWKKYHTAAALLDGFPRRDFVGVTPFQRDIRQTSVWRL